MVSVGDSQSIVRRTFICALPSQCLSDKFGMSDEVFARRTAGMTEEQLEQARQRSRDHAAQEEGKSAIEHIVGWFYPSWGTLYIHGVSYTGYGDDDAANIMSASYRIVLSADGKKGYGVNNGYALQSNPRAMSPEAFWKRETTESQRPWDHAYTCGALRIVAT